MTKKGIARALWIVWAVVVWNVVFDRVIVVAGRDYLAAARLADVGGPYPEVDRWLRPAVGRAVALATAASTTILLIGFLAIRFAREEQRDRRAPEPFPSARTGSG